MSKNILITGGAGFIGSHVVKRFVSKYPKYNIINIDKLTYAGDLKNVVEVQNKKNYFFENVDICNYDKILKIFESYKISHIINLAAESHVDRSIEDPFIFAKSNVLGTLSLLNAAKTYWKNNFKNKLFYHISTDEVYGSLGKTGLFKETTPYDPHSPYSASKASSDHFVRSFNDTYGLPTLISNCSNNFGPNQYPEKLIPVVIKNIIDGNNIPIYGDGKNIRDWLYVENHVDAIDIIFNSTKYGETYNVGGYNELTNVDLVNILIDTIDKILGNKVGYSKKLISYVKDRPGHDLRYAIDSTKIKKELGWVPNISFEAGIENTVRWYLNFYEKKY